MCKYISLLIALFCLIAFSNQSFAQNYLAITLSSKTAQISQLKNNHYLIKMSGINKDTSTIEKSATIKKKTFSTLPIDHLKEESSKNIRLTGVLYFLKDANKTPTTFLFNITNIQYDIAANTATIKAKAFPFRNNQTPYATKQNNAVFILNGTVS